MATGTLTPDPDTARTDYVKKCEAELIALESNRTPEDRQKIRQLVQDIAFTYAKEGPDTAQEKFKEYYDAFAVVAKTNATMAQLEPVQTSVPEALSEEKDPKGLEKIGESVGKLNVVKANMLASTLQRLPFGLGAIGTALAALVEMERNAIGITGEAQVFGILGKLIVGTDEKLKGLGINLDNTTVRDYVNTHAGQIRQTATEAAKALGISDLMAALAATPTAQALTQNSTVQGAIARVKTSPPGRR